MRIIGVDPGLSGAIAVLENNKVLNIFDISKDGFSFEQVKDHDFLKDGIVLKKLEILFKKIDK